MIGRNYSYVFICFIILFINQSHCLDTNALNGVNDLISKYNINTTGLNTTVFTSFLETFKNLTKEKCSKVSNDESAYEAIEPATNELNSCLSGLMDFEQLNKEIEEARPNGELDTVFNKYCRKRNIAIGCVENFTTTLSPCLESQEKDTKNTILTIFKRILEFVCYKDGDQIALFIAEKGPECFTQSKDALLNCSMISTSMTLENALNTDLPNELPKLIIGTEQCQKMDTLRSCTVAVLEKCEESTPANLVDALFKFIRKETPCNNNSP